MTYPFFQKKNIYSLYWVWIVLLALSLGIGMMSCRATKAKRSIRKMEEAWLLDNGKKKTPKQERKEKRETNALLRRYHKKYKTQTKIQAKEQRKRIKRGRRKPKMMQRRRGWF